MNKTTGLLFFRFLMFQLVAVLGAIVGYFASAIAAKSLAHITEWVKCPSFVNALLVISFSIILFIYLVYRNPDIVKDITLGFAKLSPFSAKHVLTLFFLGLSFGLGFYQILFLIVFARTGITC